MSTVQPSLSGDRASKMKWKEGKKRSEAERRGEGRERKYPHYSALVPVSLSLTNLAVWPALGSSAWEQSPWVREVMALHMALFRSTLGRKGILGAGLWSWVVPLVPAPDPAFILSPSPTVVVRGGSPEAGVLLGHPLLQ